MDSVTIIIYVRMKYRNRVHRLKMYYDNSYEFTHGLFTH